MIWNAYYVQYTCTSPYFDCMTQLNGRAPVCLLNKYHLGNCSILSLSNHVVNIIFLSVSKQKHTYDIFASQSFY